MTMEDTGMNKPSSSGDHRHFREDIQKMTTAIEGLTAAHTNAALGHARTHAEAMLEITKLKSDVSTIHDRGCMPGDRMVSALYGKIGELKESTDEKIEEHKKSTTRLAIIGSGVAASFTAFLSWWGLKP